MDTRPNRQQSEENPIIIPDEALPEVKAGIPQCYWCNLFGHMQPLCPSRQAKLARTARPYRDWRRVVGCRTLYSINVLWPSPPPPEVAPIQIDLTQNVAALEQDDTTTAETNGEVLVIHTVVDEVQVPDLLVGKLSLIQFNPSSVRSTGPNGDTEVVGSNFEITQVEGTPAYVEVEAAHASSDIQVTPVIEDIVENVVFGQADAEHQSFISPSTATHDGDGTITQEVLNEIVLFAGGPEGVDVMNLHEDFFLLIMPHPSRSDSSKVDVHNMLSPVDQTPATSDRFDSVPPILQIEKPSTAGAGAIVGAEDVDDDGVSQFNTTSNTDTKNDVTKASLTESEHSSAAVVPSSARSKAKVRAVRYTRPQVEEVPGAGSLMVVSWQVRTQSLRPDYSSRRAAFLYHLNGFYGYNGDSDPMKPIYEPDLTTWVSECIVIHQLGREVDISGSRDSNEWVVRELQGDGVDMPFRGVVRYHAFWSSTATSGSPSVFVANNRSYYFDNSDQMDTPFMLFRGEHPCNAICTELHLSALKI
ncbi:uncharacterized protein MELLADRAFT_114519 [Melampsora larici-populina 98AG31]|uniref:CCHC-type domain-containing protein n=1 Tax=Melampsora larici-populina (strain 98AG31 / pathotype 3-4-7) TaxID=747676 RepID=F4SDT1_MELLP|nr:uncharacterized protein MELLADRAFT_114519 [Melampsora larici-populina 98AG31]EGF97195.1 hypothetical protein MELLADRAFT_114519 [Melampsora larici-populina 98AG31]